MGKLGKYLHSIAMEKNSRAELISYNDAVTLIHDATKICWDKPPAKTYKEKKEFIRKRVNTGHESILEHGNVVMLLVIDPAYLPDLVALSFRYLNIKVVSEENNYNETVAYNALIGGSIRGYKHLFRMLEDRNNKCAQLIASILYTITSREFWIDLIDDYVLKDRFTTIMSTYEFEEGKEPVEDKEDFSELHPIQFDNPYIDICNVDDITILEDKLNSYGFVMDDYLDMVTITIKFNKMSRIITQQLTRHRNGTTQASGRYIDFSDKLVFNSPELFKDKYKDQKYSVTIGSKAFNNLTLQEIGDMLTPIYTQLRDQGVDKEDARGYLPMNTQCGPIYMTFTYRSFIKFLQLRTHQSAQAEIRMYAKLLFDVFEERLKNELHCNDIYSYLEPAYKTREYIYESTEALDEITEEIIEEENNDGNEN